MTRCNLRGSSRPFNAVTRVLKHPSQDNTMRRACAIASLACVGLMGCRAGPAPSSPVPQTSPAPTPGAAAPTPDTVPEPAPTPNPEHALPELRQACSGDAVDITWVASEGKCEPPEGSDALPRTTSLRIEPYELTLQPGGQAQVHLVWLNDSQQTQALDVDFCALASYELKIFEGPKRVDYIEVCGQGGGCGSKRKVVVLEPGESARMPFTLRAQQIKQNDECRDEPPTPLPPGHYRFEIASFVESILSGKLEVRGPAESD